MKDKLLTEDQAAKLLSVSTRTLKRLRLEVKSKPPLPYITLGGCVRFDPIDLKDWARTQRFPNPRGCKKKKK